jgi:hypothetical protein
LGFIVESAGFVPKVSIIVFPEALGIAGCENHARVERADCLKNRVS